MHNIEQKIIRGLELKNYGSTRDTNSLPYTDSKEDSYKRSISDSELLRIVEIVDSDNVVFLEKKKKKIKYLKGIISINVGIKGIRKYNAIKDNDGILELVHGDYNREDKKWEESGYIETFKRIIVSSSHNRSKKALFVRLDIWEKVHKILLGGIDEYKEMNHYPQYNKSIAKWNSYYGLASTDSKVVSTPNIVVIKDFERSVTDTFDYVIQNKSLNSKWKNASEEDQKNIEKYIKTYSVDRNRNDKTTIIPFDGAGLVSVECAKRWSEELGCQNSNGKDYIPASFQFRAIPGFKGNVYTFDIDKFGSKNGYIITDIKNVKHDIREEKIDVILTESQTKFINFFCHDISLWKNEFDKSVVFYKKDDTGNNTNQIDCEYQRTFNISEYAEDSIDIKKTMLTAYQHLLTVDLTDEERVSLCQRTLDKITSVCSSMDEFLKYRIFTDEEYNDVDSKAKKQLPPYYLAAFYGDSKVRGILFRDKYFRKKVSKDIDGFKRRSCAGKLYIDGNYQVLTPDIYALAQFSFGKRGNEVTGALTDKQIYSAWWNKCKRENDKNKYLLDVPEKIALIRNPHIYMEARIVNVIKDNPLFKWFKYQTTGIITDSFSTIPLALGTADYDGDHIASTNSPEYIAAVERAINNGDGNTVMMEIVKSKGIVELEEKNKDIKYDVSDIKELMKFDVLAYKNDIGTVVDKVTRLWGIKQTKNNKKLIREYILISDIIGQLTIDAAKSGEFEPYYMEIENYLKKNKVKDPIFKIMLDKHAEKRSKEKAINENLKFDKTAKIEDYTQYSKDDINLNLIYKYMKENVGSIECDFNATLPIEKEFLSLFLSDKPNPTSPLYVDVKNKFREIISRTNKVKDESMANGSNSEDMVGNSRYLMTDARLQLLNIGKLSYEKSLNKILDIVIHLCYMDDKISKSDMAKNILWNAFASEMIERAKGNKSDIEIDFDVISQREQKTKEYAKKRNQKFLSTKNIHINELENKKRQYSLIVITQADVDVVSEVISKNQLSEHGIEIKNDDIMRLRKLYSVLMVLSKRMEYNQIVTSKKDGSKKIKHMIRNITVTKGNHQITSYVLATLCGFNDYERKNVKNYIVKLAEIGLIEMKDIAKFSFRVIYDNSDSYQKNMINEPLDYITSCKQIVKVIQKTKQRV